MFYLLSAIHLFLAPMKPVLSPQKVNLTVDVQNVRIQKGFVYIALFRAGSDFPEGKPTQGKKVEASSQQVSSIFSVEPGEYAIAVFHDENSNGKMDKKIFGIPKEPYGFSNNFRPKMSAPKFSDCQFKMSNSEKTVRIELKKF